MTLLHGGGALRRHPRASEGGGGGVGGAGPGAGAGAGHGAGPGAEIEKAFDTTQPGSALLVPNKYFQHAPLVPLAVLRVSLKPIECSYLIPERCLS